MYLKKIAIIFSLCLLICNIALAKTLPNPDTSAVSACLIDADDNGVLVIPQELLSNVIEKANNIKTTEERILKSIIMWSRYYSSPFFRNNFFRITKIHPSRSYTSSATCKNDGSSSCGHLYEIYFSEPSHVDAPEYYYQHWRPLAKLLDLQKKI